jgi:cysteinyl-tRNA synthetase, unknown class
VKAIVRTAGRLLRIGLLAVSGLHAISAPTIAAETRADATTAPVTAPAPRAAVRPPAKAAATKISAAEATAQRLKRITAVKSWGYQLAALSLNTAAASPYDLIVVDATAGLDTGGFTREQVDRLKRAPDGSRRIVISYLSIGEAEDYRADYFSPEYMEEEAPDWLMKENPQWKGNRIIRFCSEGWQKTILGDENGFNVYSGDAPSPLYKLLELGFDGVYLDRVDVYSEITKECPDGANKMVEFVARLAAHARKKDPQFLVILQNAEELLAHPKMVETIDAIAKESVFYGGDMSQRRNSQEQVDSVLRYLRMARSAGRAVFVVDYVTDKARNADAVKRISAEGFVPYIGPRDLAKLWLPGVNF